MTINKATARADKSTVRKFLDCSTAHVSEGTADWLQERGRDTAESPHESSHSVGITPFGWFVYADEEATTTNFPSDLIGVMQFARKNGCEYILFDCDGPTHNGLPAFDW